MTYDWASPMIATIKFINIRASEAEASIQKAFSYTVISSKSKFPSKVLYIPKKIRPN